MGILKIRRTQSPRQRSRFAWHKLLPIVTTGVGLLAGICLLVTLLALRAAAQHPVDGTLVLGGSIQREIYAAQVAQQSPDVPILISHGSLDPCILLIFQRANASLDQVWLEKCADSTFGNFYFSLPILQQWKVHKVRLITSPTHLPRAQWLAQIILGSHGIWVVPDLVQEQGIPGNQESWLKTGLDVTRSLGWAIASHFYRPSCSEVVPLSQVNLDTWETQGFKCEHQAGLDDAY